MLEKGYRALASILNNLGPDVIDTVVLSKDKSIKDDYWNEIKQLCDSAGVITIDRQEVVTIKTQYSIAIAWRWLIPANHTKIITLHDSLLPKYRGFAPLVNQLIHHEPALGVTAILSSDEYDRGEVISQQSIDITYPLKIQEAITKVSPLYSKLTVDIIAMIRTGSSLVTFAQDEKQATYSLWRDDEDYRIDWQQNASYLRRFIDAVGHPYKGASAYIGERQIRIHNAQEEDDVTIVNRDCGKVIFVRSERPVVVCGEGLLRILDATWEDGSAVFPNNKFRLRFS